MAITAYTVAGGLIGSIFGRLLWEMAAATDRWYIGAIVGAILCAVVTPIALAIVAPSLFYVPRSHLDTNDPVELIITSATRCGAFLAAQGFVRGGLLKAVVEGIAGAILGALIGAIVWGIKAAKKRAE